MRKSAATVPSMRSVGTNEFPGKKIRREHLRWRCLSFLDEVRPAMMTDIALLALIQAIYPDATASELRREVDYLAMRELLTTAEHGGVWHLKLTFQGVDVVEFTSACPPGIGRSPMPE